MTQTVQAPSGPSTVVLSRADWQTVRGACEADPFVFAKLVCGHFDLSEQTHRPLMYLVGGCLDKLIDILNSPSEQSYTVRKIRAALEAKGVDWNTPDGLTALQRYSTRLNIRLFRGSGKSSALTHATLLWMITRDPDLSVAIISNADEKAEEFCDQIRRTIKSDIYRALFPERIPANEISDLTQNSLRLGGRTNPAMEPTVLAFGYTSFDKAAGYHFDVFYVDDLVTEKNSSPVVLAGAVRYLAGLPNMDTPGKRVPVRRIHIGTKYSESDDDADLCKKPGYLSIRVPIEDHGGLVEDLWTAGEPTCPEWRSAEDIARAKDEELPGDDGPMVWRCNKLLDASAGGGKLFPDALVDSCLFKEVEIKDSRGRNVKALAHPKFDPKTRLPLRSENGLQIYTAVNPDRLFIALGCDQAFSEEDGSDEWAVSVVGQSSTSVMFLLETLAGHGYQSMLDALLSLNDKYHPAAIGLEKAAMQGTTKFWMDRSPQFRKLQGKLHDISHKNKDKDWWMINCIAEPMRMKQFYTYPAGEAVRAEMKAYRKGPKAKDNRIDSISIAVRTLRKPTEKNALKKDQDRFRRTYEQSVDPQTGIYLG